MKKIGRVNKTKPSAIKLPKKVYVDLSENYDTVESN